MEMRLTVLIDRKRSSRCAWADRVHRAPGQPTHLILGDTVTVTGSQVSAGGEAFLIAATVTRGRTSCDCETRMGIQNGWDGKQRVSDRDAVRPSTG
jgi:hypothetical protein